MKKLYEKNEVTFAVVWIIIYCVVQSLAMNLNELTGIDYSVSAVLCAVQAVVLFLFVKKNCLMEKYGLCKPKASAKRHLFYIPLLILVFGHLWNGATLGNYPPADLACRTVSMLFVGFIEELIFRGFLFKAMAKKNIKPAIIVSSVTFGVGHLVNLFNGSGMDLVDNICQILFAVAVGFLLVTIFYRGGSLIPCIIAHSANNMITAFADGTNVTVTMEIAYCLIITAILVASTLILNKTLPKNQSDT